MSVHSQVINQILVLLKEIKYGSISITVHDGKIMQVESTKKVRFISNSNGINNRY